MLHFPEVDTTSLYLVCCLALCAMHITLTELSFSYSDSKNLTWGNPCFAFHKTIRVCISQKELWDKKDEGRSQMVCF